jgi:MICOS complex subunit MIC60
MPHLQEAGLGKFLFIISPFAVGGGVVAYAKYDPEFRKTLVQNVPAIEPVLEVFIDDKNPFEDVQKKFNEYTSSVSSSIDSVKSTVTNASSTVTGFFGGSSNEPKSKYEI